MRIAPELVEQMVAHAREDLPNECCGMIGGRDGEATSVLRVANSAASPLRYEMDPQAQFDALKSIEAGGDELLGIYHSHTSSPAYPSRTDAEQAFWPDAVYVIVSLAGADPDVRGYRIHDMSITEEALRVE